MSKADAAIGFALAKDGWFEDRFETKVAPAEDGSGCLLWRASTGPWGYGVITVAIPGKVARVSMLAHRVAFARANGVLPPRGHVIVHRCLRHTCVNPDHLVAVPPYLVTEKRRQFVGADI